MENGEGKGAGGESGLKAPSQAVQRKGLLGSFPAVSPPPGYAALSVVQRVSFLVTILILIIELSAHSSTTSWLFLCAVRRRARCLSC